MIFLVDDNDELREALVEFVRLLGFDVQAFAAAEDALRALNGRHQGIELLITDLALPGMSGTDFLRHFTRDAPAVPIIVLSTYSLDTLNGAAPSNARIEHLRKPVGLARLGEAITSATSLVPTQ